MRLGVDVIEEGGGLGVGHGQAAGSQRVAAALGGHRLDLLVEGVAGQTLGCGGARRNRASGSFARQRSSSARVR